MPRIKSGVKVKDRGYKRIIGELESFDGAYTKVGLMGTESPPDTEFTYPQIGAVHEYGARIPVTDAMRGWFAAQGYPLSPSTTEIVIPERSFVRAGVDENRRAIEAQIDELHDAVLQQRMTARQAIQQLGEWGATIIRNKATRGPFTPNSGMTVARKGSSRPLRDTGRMVQTITHEDHIP